MGKLPSLNESRIIHLIAIIWIVLGFISLVQGVVFLALDNAVLHPKDALVTIYAYTSHIALLRAGSGLLIAAGVVTQLNAAALIASRKAFRQNKDSVNRVTLLCITWMLVPLFLWVGAAVIGALHKNAADGLPESVSRTLRLDFLRAQRNYERRGAWLRYQEKHVCCGVESYKDWFEQQSGWKKVPNSCCLEPKPGCGATGQPELWAPRGCAEKHIKLLNPALPEHSAFFWLYALVHVMILAAAFTVYVRHNAAVLGHKRMVEEEPTAAEVGQQQAQTENRPDAIAPRDTAHI